MLRKDCVCLPRPNVGGGDSLWYSPKKRKKNSIEAKFSSKIPKIRICKHLPDACVSRASTTSISQSNDTPVSKIQVIIVQHREDDTQSMQKLDMHI